MTVKQKLELLVKIFKPTLTVPKPTFPLLSPINFLVPNWCKYLVVRGRYLENFRENLTQQLRTNIHKTLLKHRSKLNSPSRCDVDVIQCLNKTSEWKVKVKSKREGTGKKKKGADELETKLIRTYNGGGSFTLNLLFTCQKEVSIPRWNFSWCFSLANRDLKCSSQ